MLKVASLTSTIDFSKTDAEVATILRWLIKDWASPPPEGLTQAQLNKYNLDQAAARIVDMVRQEAARIRLRELRDEQASIEDQAASETSL